MRRTLLMIMAVALLLTQCRKPAVEFPTAEPANTVSMTITAGPGGKTDISETGGITWSEGDMIYVGHDGKYVGYLTLQSGQNTPTGTFTGDVTLPNSTTGEQTFHFFYLGSGSQTLTAGESTQATVSFAEQTGLRGGLGSCHVGHGSAKGAVSAGGVTGISVMMKSEVALSRFSFKKSGTPEGYPGALTLSGDHIYNSMKVNFGGTFTGEKTDGGKISLTDATSSEKYVMLVPAGTTAATLKFDAGAGTTDCNLANGIEANKYYGQGGAIEVTVKAPVHVTGVTLNKTSLPLTTGSTETLTATVDPDDATNKSVTWNSDNTDVATVDGTGKVTAVAVGTATITVTTVDGGKTATCTVTVSPVHHVTSVSLDKTNLSLAVDATATLTATVSPDNATDKSVTWSSTAPGVATVSDAGLVTAVAVGEATIIVTTVDGDKTAECDVTVTAPTHEYVDLGLSVKWATCNLGASNPEEYGDYYAWGETAPYYKNGEWCAHPSHNESIAFDASVGYGWKNYLDGNSTSWNASLDWKPYGDDKILTSDYDAATANWGSDWRMPTPEEWQELKDSCTWTWTTQGGMKGYLVTGPSGNSIFLPAVGLRSGTKLNNAGSYGVYWSNLRNRVAQANAVCMYFTQTSQIAQYDQAQRGLGVAVRPVLKAL